MRLVRKMFIRECPKSLKYNITERTYGKKTFNTTAPQPGSKRNMKKTSTIKQMNSPDVTKAELKLAIESTAKWKASAIDGVPNF